MVEQAPLKKKIRLNIKPGKTISTKDSECSFEDGSLQITEDDSTESFVEGRG